MREVYPNPRIVPLAEAHLHEVGGKAAGLAHMMAQGLSVPTGFVIVGARSDHLPHDLGDAFASLGSGPVAVRSSALAEDGHHKSFAGQYDTVLNVQGLQDLTRAVQRCLESFSSAQAQAYREGETGRDEMAVIVQRMVSARAAGVLFTVDPVSARRDRLVVDAVSGLGEKLVSGTARPDQYRLDRTGNVVHRDLVGAQALLSDKELGHLARQARQTERSFGYPLDCEWAIDEGGDIHWLQARPITSLGPDVHELDTPIAADHVLTRANVGEMMPGAVCPLDISITAYGVDQGIQEMLVSCGALSARQEQLLTLSVFSGQLLFNLSGMGSFCRKVGGSTAEQLTLAICGRVVPELDTGRPARPWTRLYNGLRYARYLMLAKSRIEELEQLGRTFKIDQPAKAADMYSQLQRNMEVLVRAYTIHLQVSAVSGALSGILQGVLSKGKPPTPEQEAELARLLAGAQGVESADMVADMDRLVELIGQTADPVATFGKASPEDALRWLDSPEAQAAGEAFRKFIGRHGHRTLRELSLYQPGWRDDPLPLIRSLQTALLAGLGNPNAGHQAPELARADSRVLRLILGWLHESVRRREYTKSLLVRVADRFKRAYRHLAAVMYQEGLLPDEDALFFLSHEELGRRAAGLDEHLIQRALERREAFVQQQGIVLPMVWVGHPDSGPETADLSAEGVLLGKPVSRGLVRGPARVVHSLEQALKIQSGDILIAPVTDVGWTPFFRLIGGLATEVGSAISHGAVVAREYGLPAVVNLTGVTQAFCDGDLVELDGDKGTLRLIQARSEEE